MVHDLIIQAESNRDSDLFHIRYEGNAINLFNLLSFIDELKGKTITVSSVCENSLPNYKTILLLNTTKNELRNIYYKKL